MGAVADWDVRFNSIGAGYSGSSFLNGSLTLSADSGPDQVVVN
jgi:hypothetical protein